MRIDPFEFERERQRERLETKRNEMLFSIQISKELRECIDDRLEALEAGLRATDRYEVGLEFVHNAEELQIAKNRYEEECELYGARSTNAVTKFQKLSEQKRFEDDDNDNR